MTFDVSCRAPRRRDFDIGSSAPGRIPAGAAKANIGKSSTTDRADYFSVLTSRDLGEGVVTTGGFAKLTTHSLRWVNDGDVKIYVDTRQIALRSLDLLIFQE
jgi:hypothetical protein